MRTLNLGILAHVDAGKTTLTERLLFSAGAIDQIGSVDAGTTQTDSLDLERERGITIRSAVASFSLDDLAVNIVDTPGHPDFIAEVERVLGVLDGAILVVSAVEGVQPQTPLLFRALQRLKVPTLLFVNKVDRLGADPERVIEAMRRRLSPGVLAMTTTRDAGTPAASVEQRRTDDGARHATPATPVVLLWGAPSGRIPRGPLTRLHLMTIWAPLHEERVAVSLPGGAASGRGRDGTGPRAPWRRHPTRTLGGTHLVASCPRSRGAHPEVRIVRHGRLLDPVRGHHRPVQDPVRARRHPRPPRRPLTNARGAEGSP